MAAAICGHLRLKGEAAKLRGRRICCSFGDESLTIKGEVSTFLAVQRSAFGENWRQRGNVLKPTLVLRDGASETEVNVDALLRGEASVVEAALDDSVRFWIEYIPAPPEPRRGDVVELEPWSHHGAVVPHNNDGLDFTVDACADGLVRFTWAERPAAMSDNDTPWQCNVTLPRPAVRVARQHGAATGPGLELDDVAAPRLRWGWYVLDPEFQRVVERRLDDRGLAAEQLVHVSRDLGRAIT